jgi:hypothetical protein
MLFYETFFIPNISDRIDLKSASHEEKPKNERAKTAPGILALL